MQNKGFPLRLKALIIKEFLQIIRDPSSILISVVLPLILLFVLGYGVSLDMDHLHIGIVMEDTAPDAQSFVQSLTDSPYFITKVVRHRHELETDIISGHIRGIVVIPSYFSAFRSRQDNIAPIQVIADGSEPNTASFVQNYVAGAWQTWLQQEKISSNLSGLPAVNIEQDFGIIPNLKVDIFYCLDLSP
jgi:ABC-2 type transport system permease protein